MKRGYVDVGDEDPKPWIAIDANRGGCIILSVLTALACYGLYRLIF